MLRANRFVTCGLQSQRARSVGACSRHMGTARPESGASKPPPSATSAPGTAGNGSASTGATKAAPSTSSSSSGPGVGTFLILSALSAPAVTAVYLKQNPQWQPELVKYDANWIKFRELVLGDATKESKAVASTKQIIPAAKVATPAKEPTKSAEELSALISKANPAATLSKPAAATVAPATKASETKAPIEPKAKTNDATKSSLADKKATKTKKSDEKVAIEEVATPVTKKETAANGEKKAEAEVSKLAESSKTVAEAPKPASAPVQGKAIVVKAVDDAVTKERKAIDALAAEATPAALGVKVDKQIQSTTKEILSTLQAESNAAAVDVDTNYLAGIHELDANALAIRVAQLATEMKHRSKWEAVRLLEALRRMEEDTKKKSTDVLERQEKLHKEVLERELRLKEEMLTRATREEMHALKKQYTDELARNVAEYKTAITKELQDKFAAEKKAIEDRFTTQLKAKSQELQETLTKERKQRVAELENYRAHLRALNAVLERTSTYEAFSHQVHKASMAALALSDRIEAAGPLNAEIKALREFARNDPLIDAALKTLPPQVIDEGALSVGQLQERFQTVKTVGRRAAMVPENSGLLGQLFGGALSYLIIPPGGPIEGQDAEAVFSRADYALKAGDIETALEEMKTLQGLPADVSRDWVAAAEARLAVEQTAKVVKAHIALLAASCS